MCPIEKSNLNPALTSTLLRDLAKNLDLWGFYLKTIFFTMGIKFRRRILQGGFKMLERQQLMKAGSIRHARLPVVSQEQALLRLARENQWPFRVVGVAPVPETPVFHNRWWLVPVSLETNPIPARALERVQAIYEAGIRPKAWVIAHEAPAQLPAPKNVPQMSSLDFWTKTMVQHSASVVKVAGTILVAVTPVLLSILGAGLLLSVGLLGALVTDPCLIAITEDDVWVQVDFWMV
jgi:hypothetical protein